MAHPSIVLAVQSRCQACLELATKPFVPMCRVKTPRRTLSLCKDVIGTVDVQIVHKLYTLNEKYMYFYSFLLPFSSYDDNFLRLTMFQ